MGGIDDWPQPVVDDVQRLLVGLGPYTQEIVINDGALWPCGSAILMDGGVQSLTVAPVGFDSTQDALAFLVAATIESRDQYRAICIATTIELPGYDGAIEFATEHVDGYSIAWIMRYKRTRYLKTVLFDDLAYVEIPSMIWRFDLDSST